MKELAKELNVNVEDVIKICDEKVVSGKTGMGRNLWLTEEAVDVVKLALAAPLLAPGKLEGRVVRPAANPSWAYVKIDGFGSLVPVAVPRRYRERCVGKIIPIEAISDATGETTYRYDLNPR